MEVEDLLFTYFWLIPDKTCISHFVFLHMYYKNLLLFGDLIQIYFNGT